MEITPADFESSTFYLDPVKHFFKDCSPSPVKHFSKNWSIFPVKHFSKHSPISPDIDPFHCKHISKY